MLKKTIIIISLFFIFFPLAKTQASTTEVYRYSSGDVGQSVISHTFSKPQDLSEYVLRVESFHKELLVTFYNENSIIASVRLSGGTNVRRTLPDKYNNVTRITIRSSHSSYIVGLRSPNFFALYGVDSVSHEINDVENVNYKTSYDYVQINYDIPENPNFSHIDIYKDEKLIISNYKNKSFVDYDVTPETNYIYRIVSFGKDGTRTEGYILNLKTDKEPLPPSDIKNVNFKTTETEIYIEYDLPEEADFSHIEIYKNGELYFPNYKQKTFKDPNLKADTKYIYKFISVSTHNKKSNGITVEVKTDKYDTEIEGVGNEVDQNGNYIFSWEKPVVGEMRILVNGKEYKVTQASAKRIEIPKEDMVYDTFGNPKVTLQAIAPDGTTGEKVDSGIKTKFPINLLDIVSGSMHLIASVGGFLLLALAFYFQEPLLNLLKTGFVVARKWGRF